MGESWPIPCTSSPVHLNYKNAWRKTKAIQICIRSQSVKKNDINLHGFNKKGQAQEKHLNEAHGWANSHWFSSQNNLASVFLASRCHCTILNQTCSYDWWEDQPAVQPGISAILVHQTELLMWLLPVCSHQGDRQDGRISITFIALESIWARLRWLQRDVLRISNSSSPALSR